MPKSHRHMYLYENNKNTLHKHNQKAKIKEKNEIITIIDDNDVIVDKNDLANPLNILELLYLYQIKSPRVLNNNKLLGIIAQIQQDLYLDLDTLQFNSKRIKDIWMYQMKCNNLVCDICGNQIVKQGDLSLDHKYPKSLGGKADVENSKPVHKLCNSLKGCIPPRTWEAVGEEILKTKQINIIKNCCGYNYKGR